MLSEYMAEGRHWSNDDENQKRRNICAKKKTKNEGGYLIYEYLPNEWSQNHNSPLFLLTAFAKDEWFKW